MTVRTCEVTSPFGHNYGSSDTIVCMPERSTGGGATFLLAVAAAEGGAAMVLMACDVACARLQ